MFVKDNKFKYLLEYVAHKHRDKYKLALMEIEAGL